MPLNKYAGWGQFPAPAVPPPNAVRNAALAFTVALSPNGPLARLAHAVKTASDKRVAAVEKVADQFHAHGTLARKFDDLIQAVKQRPIGVVVSRPRGSVKLAVVGKSAAKRARKSAKKQ